MPCILASALFPNNQYCVFSSKVSFILEDNRWAVWWRGSNLLFDKVQDMQTWWNYTYGMNWWALVLKSEQLSSFTSLMIFWMTAKAIDKWTFDTHEMCDLLLSSSDWNMLSYCRNIGGTFYITHSLSLLKVNVVCIYNQFRSQQWREKKRRWCELKSWSATCNLWLHTYLDIHTYSSLIKKTTQSVTYGIPWPLSHCVLQYL